MMSENRLLVFAQRFPPAVGGTPTVLRNLFRHLPPERLAVLSQDDGGMQDDSWKPDFPCVRLPRPGRVSRRLDAMGAHLVPYVAFRARRMVRKESLRAVLGIFPESCFSAAAWVVAKVMRKPLYFYFMDTWYETRAYKFERVFARWVEPKIFGRSEYVFCVSPFLCEFFQRKYPLYASKVVCIPHIVDASVRTNPYVGNGQHLGRLLVFTGQVYGSNADALRNVITAMNYIDDMDPKFILCTPDPVYRLRKLGFEEAERVKMVCLQNQQQVFTLQQRADVLINPISLKRAHSPQIQTLFPTKTFEYLRARRPMLVHGPSSAGFVQYARQRGFAYVVDEDDPQKVACSLREAIVCGIPPVMQEAMEAELQAHSPEFVVPVFRRYLGI